jgi:MFS family permease
MSAVFRSLAVRNYRYWFAGALVSNIGAWMQRTAQDWIVLTELTDHDAAAVGVVTALQLGPQLVLTPVAGMVNDRFDRRRVLLVTQALMGVLAFLLGAFVLLGHPTLWHLYGFALALGIVSAFDTPVRQTFVSDLVPRDLVGNAVALNSTSFNLSRLAGPAIAGLLVAAVGSGWVFLINGVTFVAVIAAVLAIRPDELIGSGAPRARTTRRVGFLDGLRYLRDRSDLRLVMVMVFIISTLGLNFPVVLSAMVTLTFHQQAEVYGVMSSVMGVGSLTGALLSAARSRPRLRTIVGGALGFGLASIGAAVAPGLGTFAIALVVQGMFVLTILASANGFVQLGCAPAVRGRVMAVYMAVLMGGTPIGAPFAGWVANTFGPRWAMGVSAIAGFSAVGVAAWWLFLTRGGRLHRDPEGGLRHPLVLDLPDEPGATPEPITQPIATMTTEIAVIDTDALRGRRRGDPR